MHHSRFQGSRFPGNRDQDEAAPRSALLKFRFHRDPLLVPSKLSRARRFTLFQVPHNLCPSFRRVNCGIIRESFRGREHILVSLDVMPPLLQGCLFCAMLSHHDNLLRLNLCFHITTLLSLETSGSTEQCRFHLAIEVGRGEMLCRGVGALILTSGDRDILQVFLLSASGRSMSFWMRMLRSSRTSASYCPVDHPSQLRDLPCLDLVFKGVDTGASQPLLASIYPLPFPQGW